MVIGSHSPLRTDSPTLRGVAGEWVGAEFPRHRAKEMHLISRRSAGSAYAARRMGGNRQWWKSQRAKHYDHQGKNLHWQQRLRWSGKVAWAEGEREELAQGTFKRMSNDVSGLAPVVPRQRKREKPT
jgi:hypothetical protein